MIHHHTKYEGTEHVGTNNFCPEQDVSTDRGHIETSIPCLTLLPGWMYKYIRGSHESVQSMT